MNLLMLSNLYPPHVIGGYETLCQEAVEYLRAHGHTVYVLTSDYGEPGPCVEGKVYRVLEMESGMAHYRPLNTFRYRQVSHRNRRQLREVVATVKPDAILVWGMWHLSRSVLYEAESMGRPPVVYYLASPWPVERSAPAEYWDAPAQRAGRKIVKRLLAPAARLACPEAWNPPPLRFEHAISNTISLRDQLVAAGHRLQDAAIICEGVDLTPYQSMAPRVRQAGEPLRLVFVGRLGWHKGPHTIIEALSELKHHRGRTDVTLTICGGGQPEYAQGLHDLVEKDGLGSQITFQKPIPREDLPAFLWLFDALVLSSIWDEALARIMQEAMAAARVLIGTPTGASKEFLFDGQNALTFPPGDAQRLADQIVRLADDPALGRRLALAGKELALDRFDVQRMMADIEAYIVNLVAQDGHRNVGGQSHAL